MLAWLQRLRAGALHPSEGFFADFRHLGVDHAATLVGGWLFDSNLPRALPLSRESLDTMVALTHHGERFSQVSRAVQLIAGDSVLELEPVKRKREQLELERS